MCCTELVVCVVCYTSHAQEPYLLMIWLLPAQQHHWCIRHLPCLVTKYTVARAPGEQR